MRKIVLGVCILAITVLAGVRSLPAQDAVSELKKLDEQRMKSINDGDIAAVGALLADDYVHVHNTGEVNNKAQYLAFLQAQPEYQVHVPDEWLCSDTEVLALIDARLRRALRNVSAARPTPLTRRSP